MNELDQMESDLLEVAYKIFSKTHARDVLAVLASRKYANMGFEGWMQTELVAGLHERSYDVRTDGKVKRGCDLIITKEKREKLVELRAATPEKPWGWLMDGVLRHPKATMYMFLCRAGHGTTITKLQELAQERFLKKLTIEPRPLDNDWIVMIAKQAKIGT